MNTLSKSNALGNSLGKPRAIIRMSKRDGEQPVTTNLRVDGGLHNQLVAAAAKSVRSINGEIVWRLKCSFEREAGEAAEAAA